MAEENNAELKRAVMLQIPCAEAIEKIIAKRKERGIVETKVRIIAEAVSELAKKELND